MEKSWKCFFNFCGNPVNEIVMDLLQSNCCSIRLKVKLGNITWASHHRAVKVPCAVNCQYNMGAYEAISKLSLVTRKSSLLDVNSKAYKDADQTEYASLSAPAPSKSVDQLSHLV